LTEPAILAIIVATVNNKERHMGYKVLNTVDNMRDNYGPRAGLEGPFNFSGRVLYYDPKEGQYWDPRSDFFIERDEMSLIRDTFLKKFG